MTSHTGTILYTWFRCATRRSREPGAPTGRRHRHAGAHPPAVELGQRRDLGLHRVVGVAVGHRVRVPRPFAATGVAASAVVAAGFIVGEPIRNLARPGNRILIDGRSTHHAALTVRADQTLRGGGRSGWLLEDCGPPTSAAESGCLPRSGH